MTLYIIGLGLGDEKDITLKGLEAVKKCEKVYLECYTSAMQAGRERLERLYGKRLIPAGRDMLENRPEKTILKDAKDWDTALLVVGDPLSATTHNDLRLRAIKAGTEVKLIHNASVLNAVGITGLELYKFGKTVSIPFGNSTVRAPFDAYLKNDKIGLHTLFLLDIEPEKDRFMTISEALGYLIRCGLDGKSMCVGCAGLGSEKYEIACACARVLKEHEFSRKPQCLIVPSKLHFMEEETLEIWKIKS